MSNHEHAHQDNRSHERIEVSEVVRVTDRQTGTEIGQLVNISDQGLMIQSPSAVTENSILQLALEFPEGSPSATAGPLHVGVECLWANASAGDSGYWVGFYIIDISDADLERIHAMSR